jgi:hypothetical protein
MVPARPAQAAVKDAHGQDAALSSICRVVKVQKNLGHTEAHDPNGAGLQDCPNDVASLEMFLLDYTYISPLYSMEFVHLFLVPASIAPETARETLDRAGHGI